MPEIVVDEKLCSGCGTCVEACPMEVLCLENERARAKKPDNCMVCRLCEVDCENQAIKVNE